ncbi:MAG TPA: limonene-1,2-epoxide hydrolase family protein [Marmoricola sp.]|jgi:limonene-1,2-epoxide hydrolase|nr:limonene-1,2-epoxide hydrolase family protein [Marmoricola sp.]
MTGPVDVVRRFFALLDATQAAEAVALLSDDVVWRNTGFPAVRGQRVGGMLLDMERRGIAFEARIRHAAADGPVVLTDRIDVLRYKRWESAFPVSGTFEVHDGRITLWDDRFSPGGVLLASLKGLVAAAR